MTPRRFTPSFLLALAATAGTAGAAQAAAPHHAATPAAVARSEAQAQGIATALREGRLTTAQADTLNAARATQERRARELAAAHPTDVAAALELSHQQDRLDWAIRSGNTQFVNTAPVTLR